MGEKPFISIGETYFHRFQSSKSHILTPPDALVKLIVVIPSFNEPKLIESVKSLCVCDIPKNCAIEIIVVVNHPLDASSAIVKLSKQNLIDLGKIQPNKRIQIHCIYANDLNPKFAGVGWARKIGMDEALRRFLHVNYDGIICCFDADSIVQKNYFTAIYNKLGSNLYAGASIYFEHPIFGNSFKSAEYENIILYETHLRYYKNALQFCGFPFAFHTVGSSMAVKASAYAKQGGMNRRKAGEDFYFINKIIALGNYTEINNTTVIPSPRTSDRVPFGTGRAILDALNHKKDLSLTYDFSTFRVIRNWVEQILVSKMYNYSSFHPFVQSFLSEADWNKKIDSISKNTSSEKKFNNRFFQVFNPFWVLKYVHHIRQNHVKDSSLLENTNALFSEFGFSKSNSIREALILFRSIDKKIGDRGPLK